MRLAPNCICRDQDARPAHALVAAPAKTDCTVTVCTDLYTRPPGIERNVRDRHQLPGTQARQPPRPGSMPETKRDIGDLRRAAHDPATARVQLPAGLASGARTGPCRHMPDQAVACGGERSLMGTPTGRLTRTIVVTAVLEKYS